MSIEAGLFGIVILIACLLVAMVVHEFMHAYIGFKLGDTTARDEGRLSLNPLQHIDPFMTVLLPAITLALFGVFIAAAKPVPFNPGRVKFEEFGAAMIAASGPFANLGLAIISAIVLSLADPTGLLRSIVMSFLEINVMLFIFNLIPIPPLDGSRVLYAFAPQPVQDFMERIEPFGFFIIFALVLMGGLGGILSTLSGNLIDILT